MRLVRSVFLLALFATGCSGADPFVGPATIDGKWAESFSIAGNFLNMELVTIAVRRDPGAFSPWWEQSTELRYTSISPSMNRCHGPVTR